MSKALAPLSLLLVFSLPGTVSAGSEKPSSGGKITLDSSTKLELINADAKWVEYRGRHALHVVPLPGHEKSQNEELMAVLPDSDFKNGTIEIDVAGARRAGPPPRPFAPIARPRAKGRLGAPRGGHGCWSPPAARPSSWPESSCRSRNSPSAFAGARRCATGPAIRGTGARSNGRHPPLRQPSTLRCSRTSNQRRPTG